MKGLGSMTHDPKQYTMSAYHTGCHQNSLYVSVCVRVHGIQESKESFHQRGVCRPIPVWTEPQQTDRRVTTSLGCVLLQVREHAPNK